MTDHLLLNSEYACYNVPRLLMLENGISILANLKYRRYLFAVCYVELEES